MYEKNMAQDNKVPEQNKKMPKIEGMERRRTKKIGRKKKKSEYRTNGIERF